MAAVGIKAPPKESPHSHLLPSSVLSTSGHFLPANHNALVPVVDDDLDYEVYSLPLDGPTKATSLMTKLEAIFPHETAFKQNNIFVSTHHSSSDTTSSSASQPSRPVFVFIDHSNIHLGFIKYMKQYYPQLDYRQFKRARSTSVGVGGSRKIRMDYDSLLAVIERGRRVVHRYLAASSPLYQNLNVPVARGYEVQVASPPPSAHDFSRS